MEPGEADKLISELVRMLHSYDIANAVLSDCVSLGASLMAASTVRNILENPKEAGRHIAKAGIEGQADDLVCELVKMSIRFIKEHDMEVEEVRIG